MDLIEKEIYDYLVREFPVFPEMPDPAPERLVLMEKAGAGRADRLWRTTLILQSYGRSVFDAAVLSEAVRDRMLLMPEESDRVTRVTLNSEYNYPDMDRRRHRYQAVFDIIHY